MYIVRHMEKICWFLITRPTFTERTNHVSSYDFCKKTEYFWLTVTILLNTFNISNCPSTTWQDPFWWHSETGFDLQLSYHHLTEPFFWWHSETGLPSYHLVKLHYAVKFQMLHRIITFENVISHCNIILLQHDVTL